VRHGCYAVTGFSARLALIVARRQLIICPRNSQRNCALRSLFGVDEWRRQRLSAGPRAVSQILRLTSTPTATTLEFFRFGADRRAVCWLPISVRAPRLERPAPRSHSFLSRAL